MAPDWAGRWIVLPQQRHLAVAVLEKAPHLGDDGLRIAAPLAAPGIGHHAVGTEVVASAHDRHEGAHAVAVETHGSDLGIGLLGREQHVDALAAGLGLADQARQIAVGVGPGHDIDAVGPFDQLFAQTLGHAADDAHHQPRTFAPVALHLGQPAPDALLGVVADRTGVDEYDIGLVDPVRIDVTLALHDGDDRLGVADVHLTAVGLDEQPASRSFERPQCIDIKPQFLILNCSFLIAKPAIPRVSRSSRGTA